MKTTFQIRQYPKLIEEFARENFNLKTLLGVLLALLLTNVLVLACFVRRGPTVIALEAGGDVAVVGSKVTDLQIQSAIRQYLSLRYNWTDATIGGQLKKAEFFVSPSLVQAFQKSMIDVQKFVREKKVTQRLYPRSIEVNITERMVTVVADRITEFDQLKAATEMRLVLSILVDDRTVINPWGVYVTKETEKAAE